MYALASLGLRRSARVIPVAGAALGGLPGVAGSPPLCWCDLRGRHAALPGVGCMPWRRWVSAALLV